MTTPMRCSTGLRGHYPRPRKLDTARRQEYAERCYVAENIREARKRAGRSVADIARAMGLTRQAVYAIEEGRYLPRYRKAIKVAEWIRRTLA